MLLLFSEKYTRFCQWKSVELNVVVSCVKTMYYLE
jgi:hypothetical protein